MTSPTPRDWEALKKLAEAATPGTWEASGPTVWVEDVEYGVEPDCCGQFNRDGSCCGNAIPRQTQEQVQREIASACDLDAAFIAAANPATVLDLIAEVERLWAELDQQSKVVQATFKTHGEQNVEMKSLRAELSQLKAERDRMAEALAILEPKKPADDPKDGPCCHEQAEDGFWICTGCTCQNYGDAQSATLWADAMNRWIEWNNLTQKPGEKPMTNASDITARDAALLFRNPTHFSELIEAFEASAETDTAGKLDDALKSVARSALNTGET